MDNNNKQNNNASNDLEKQFKRAVKYVVICSIITVLSLAILFLWSQRNHRNYTKPQKAATTTTQVQYTRAEHTYTTAERKSYSSASVGSLKFGDLISENENGSTIVIKAKITPKWSNKTTIDQNYHNVEDLILNNGYDKYDEIQYWAVADMTDGSEAKVISFTVSKSLIKKIKDGSVVAIVMGDYVDDLYIHPSLRE